jgi:hypothetical protein
MQLLLRDAHLQAGAVQKKQVRAIAMQAYGAEDNEILLY